MQRYGSFLVRWWQVGPEERRLRVRHIQSDAELTAATLSGVMEWMAARLADAERAPPAGAIEGEEGRGPDRGPT